jgi:tetratricopeptide (TPR) repeat protein
VPDKFTNLQILPKDISKPELQSTMRGFAFALGVRCNYCHAEKKNSDTPGLDYASDEKETKKIARVMLQMVAAINHNYIAKLPATSSPAAISNSSPTTQPAAPSAPPPAQPVQVQCVTCHHGLVQPRTLNSVLAEAIDQKGADADQKGIDAATALYADLRKKYYGGAQYDFGETSLNQLTESLLAQKKTKEALAIAEMNFSANHPDSVWSYHLLAMTHQANGQVADAVADYRKALELHPDDDWARQQIDLLSKEK